MRASMTTPLTPSVLSLSRAAAAIALAVTTLPAQIWSEEFNVNGPPDPAVWSYDLGASGWGNNELQNYTNSPNNVQVQNGHLVITARRQGNNFTSGRIRTQDKLTFLYGTVEARIQVPDLQDGLWPAFWTLGNSFGTIGWPNCGEIDVMEMGASAAIARNEVNRRVYSTAHWEFNGNRSSYGLSRLNATNVTGSFHVWRLEWTPTRLTTYIDGQWIWTMDISNPGSFGGEEFHAPHFFIVNLAVGGNYPGIWNSGGITAPMPAEYRVDYIRVYDNGFTIIGGNSSSATATKRTGPGNVDAYFCTLPIVGSPMTAGMTAAPAPFQSAAVIAYRGAASIPFLNSTLLVDPASPYLFSFPQITMQSGYGSWTIGIPNNSILAGFQMTTQGALLGPGAFALTNAVDLRFGN